MPASEGVALGAHDLALMAALGEPAHLHVAEEPVATPKREEAGDTMLDESGGALAAGRQAQRLGRSRPGGGRLLTWRVFSFFRGCFLSFSYFQKKLQLLLQKKKKTLGSCTRRRDSTWLRCDMAEEMKMKERDIGVR